MKIDYPEIAWADVRNGDTILKEIRSDSHAEYLEFTLSNKSDSHNRSATYYLIDRPREVFPEEPGTLIIAKKLAGVEYPEGVLLYRHRGHNRYAELRGGYQVRWKSPNFWVGHQNTWTEKHIEDWVLAKAVPA